MNPATIIALAFSGLDRLFSADDAGRVVRWSIGDLRSGEPILAPQREVHRGESIRDLVVVDGVLWALDELGLLGFVDDAAPIRLELPHDAHTLAYRNHRLFVAGDDHVAVLARDDRGFRPAQTVTIAAGATHDLGIDRKAERFLVVKDNKRVEIYAVGSGERLGGFQARKSVAELFARFAFTTDHLFVASNRGWGVDKVKPLSGRGGGWRTEMKTESSWCGPIVASPSGNALLVLESGADLQVFDLIGERPVFYAELMLDGEPTSLEATLTRIPRFKAIAPGLVKRVSSRQVRFAEARFTALAMSDDGRLAALGGSDDEIVLVDTELCRIERTTTTGRVVQPPCSEMLGVIDAVALGHSGGELLLVDREAQLISIDLRTQQIARLGRLGFPEPLPAIFDEPTTRQVTPAASIYVLDSILHVITYDQLFRFDRRTLAPLSVHALGVARTPCGRHLVGATAEQRQSSYPIFRFDLDTQQLEAGPPIDAGALDPGAYGVGFLGRGDQAIVHERGSRDHYFLYDFVAGLGARLDVQFARRSPCGRLLAGATDAGWRVYDLDTPDAPIAQSAAPVRKFGQFQAYAPEPTTERIAMFDRGANRVAVFSFTGELLAYLAGSGTPANHLWLSPETPTCLSFDLSGRLRRFWW